MRTTLGDAKLPASRIAQAININPCDSRFTDLINAAQEKLLEMGKWWGTYRTLYVCVNQYGITWPREVASVQGLQIAGVGVPLLNQWFEFGEATRGPDPGEACNPTWLIDRPNACQFSDTAAECRIRIYPTVAADAGAKVLLQGFDSVGNPIRTQVSGAYVWGEQVTLASPFVTSTFTFRNPGLTGVQKPVTKGRLNVFSVDPTTGTETKIATWEPSEKNPSYRRSYLTNMPNSSSCSTTSPQAEAIVRMEFIPALVDSDWLAIGNLGALRAGVKALVREDANQYQEAAIEWGNARSILVNELEKYSPTDKTFVNVQPHGTAGLGRVFAGFR